MPRGRLSTGIPCPNRQSNQGLSAVPIENEMKDKNKSSRDERDDPGNSVPYFVDQKNQCFIPQIINQLDSSSFLNLASTCKSLHSYCFNSKEIKINYPIHWISVATREGKLMFDLAKSEYELLNGGGYNYRSIDTDNKSGFLDSAENRKKLGSYPFLVRLDKLQIRAVIDAGFLASLRSFLAEFKFDSIPEVDTLGIHDWDGFVQLLMDFRTQTVFVQTISSYYDGILLSGTAMPEEAGKFFLQNTANFRSDALISDELILNSTICYLRLPLASISRTTFMDLFTRFAHSTGNMGWILGRDYFDFGHYNLFKVISFDHEGPLPDDRPLVFIKNDESIRFWILRKDETIVRCSYFRNALEFSTHYSTVFLPCLKRWV